MRKTIRGLIKGRVQGVGYRYFALDAAQALGLTGWVRNLPEGGVEFFAQGEARDLERFVDQLKIGPPMSRVEEILTSNAQPDAELDDFVISY
jgi:acylphosphatase